VCQLIVKRSAHRRKEKGAQKGRRERRKKKGKGVWSQPGIRFPITKNVCAYLKKEEKGSKGKRGKEKGKKGERKGRSRDVEAVFLHESHPLVVREGRETRRGGEKKKGEWKSSDSLSPMLYFRRKGRKRREKKRGEG